VKKQVDLANEIANKVYGKKETAPAEAPAPEAPAVPAPAAPAAEATPAAQPAAEAAPEVAPAPAAPEPAPVASELEVEKHRYKVLQGKYNNEVPRLQRTVQNLETQIQELRQQTLAQQTLLANMSKPAAPAPAPAPTKLVSDEETKEFGSDLIDVIRRAAREEVMAEVGPLIEKRLQPVAQRAEMAHTAAAATSQEVARRSQDDVLALLADEVPDWEQVNADEAFITWLQQPDAYSGEKRHDLLKRAFIRYDGPRVVAFFKGFLQEHAAVTAAPAQQPANPAASPAGTPKVQMKDLVAPGTPKQGSAVTPGSQAKRIWSSPEISQFYRDVSRGVYKGREKEAKQMEADIFLAQREGRVRK
jgi:hypothetical protein